MEREGGDEIVVVATVTKATPTSRVGINMRTDHNGEVFVSRLDNNGLIAQSTDLEPGMRILAVNGVTTDNQTPLQIREVIATAPEEVTIVAARTTGKQQTASIRQQSVRLNQELARAKEREHQELARARERELERGDKERIDDACLCCYFCSDWCIYCPAGGCDPHGQHSCCQLCCLGCESGCSALDNDCDGCDAVCDVCCSDGCEFFCGESCCDCFCGLLGAVSV
ncbi:expressed unknown protein [Seminavis robusta]|uniref:PDZ domain-containing protein n=1 Tax=Seminavis robusta TaxID=568900 RepID=A0A9N8F4E5_9STRA|nr:expressed unknown protein [Seminavis robusta]|eukprot:Sro3423_g347830.1 n/a (226) ;mRNA; r:4107-4784